MLPGKLLCLLLALQFSANTSAESDIVSTTGDAAFLPCPLPSDLQNVTKISIQWIKDGVKEPKLCRYFIESNKSYNPECRNRFSVTTKPLGLNITTVESSDAGLYTCLVTKTIPPPAKETTFNLTLQVNVKPSFTLKLMNSTDLSCVELLCSLQGLRPAHVNFTWTTASRLLHHQETSSMNSTLTLCKPNWTEGETLVCQAIYSHTSYSNNITLPCNSAHCKLEETSRLIIAVISTCVGLFLIILLGVAAICKWKKRNAENRPVVYRNKIYENFTSSNVTVNSSPRPQYVQPGARSNISRTTRSNSQTITQTQREECIYEN